MNLRVETEPEVDGRWIAEVPDLPGVLAYGVTKDEAVAKAKGWPLASSRIESSTVSCRASAGRCVM